MEGMRAVDVPRIINSPLFGHEESIGDVRGPTRLNGNRVLEGANGGLHVAGTHLVRVSKTVR